MGNTIKGFLSQVQPDDSIVVHHWTGTYYAATPVAVSQIKSWLRGMGQKMSSSCTWTRLGHSVELYI